MARLTSTPAAAAPPPPVPQPTPDAGANSHPWHARPAEEALTRLQAPRDGLSWPEAERRLGQYGPNELPHTGGHETLKVLLRQIHNPLIYVLLASTGLAMLTGKVFDGLVICGVVVLNALIGFVQEYRAGKAIKALSAMVPHGAIVVRGGQKRAVPAAMLVPGDIVLLQSGDRVPADLRLVDVRNLKVEEAALTGESMPVMKETEPVAEAATVGDRFSMAYGGTMVAAGTGSGVVVATGVRTELGRISRMLQGAAELETPLTRQLAVVGKGIALAIVAVSVLLLGLGLLRGYTLADALLAAVTLAVAAIPEGLPAIVTIALAIGVQRMARRRTIIRKLPAVETLGATTVICSDKTGTLTRNEMTVQVLYTPEGTYHLNGTEVPPVVPPAVEALATGGGLCNDAVLDPHGDGDRVTGDPTEGALLVAAHKLGLDTSVLRTRYPRLDSIPFESDRQFMATLHTAPEGGQVIYIKGAPEVILRRCHVSGDDSDGEGGGSGMRKMEAAAQIAAQGMRVLGVAARRPDRPLSQLREVDVEGGFIFLGLQGMIDPPRPEAIEAIRACHAAGITVKMITGDHRETARAVGEVLDLAEPGVSVLTGADLSLLSDDALRVAARRHHLFARVAPEHKLRLVQALQADGHVVAMTGDGVNDAPALKQANIGVAMGITGTAVSQEAADMVLADDNFASIRAAVEEGRRVYDNLIKALAFVLPTNLGLAVIMTAAVAFFPIVGGAPLLPMLPVQILWVNLVAAVALALPLAFEAMEPGLMRLPPRRPDAPVLSAFIVGRTVMVALLMAAGAIGLFLTEYFTAAAVGTPSARAVAEAQTEAVTTVILFQIFYLLQCRSLDASIVSVGLWSNPWIYAGITTVLLLQAGFIYLPFMNRIFGSVPMDATACMEAFFVALLILPMISLEKAWRRRARRRSGIPDGTT